MPIPVKIKTKPCLWILRRKRRAEMDEEETSQLNEMKEKVRAMIAARSQRRSDETASAAAVANGRLAEVDGDAENVRISSDGNAVDLDAYSDDELDAVLADAAQEYRSEQNGQEHSKSMRSRKSKSPESNSNIIAETEPEPLLTESKPDESAPHLAAKRSMKANIKRIIRTEQIREMVDKLAHVDVASKCDLERITTKECLRKLLDDVNAD